MMTVGSHKMTTGFGSSNGHGGFAASSNLSPLAPPFTVDRATLRSELNINALPYGTPYTSSFHTNWRHSQATDYEPVSEAFSPSYFRNSTSYPASTPAERQIDHVAFPSILPESNSYSQFPSSLTKNDFGVGDGNYYAPPSTWDKSSVMVRNELGYKSSSALDKVGIAQNNYTQSLSGLQYPSQWDRSWDGGLDLESAGKNRFLETIDSGTPKFTCASAYNYLKEGSKMTEVLGNASGESCLPQINNVIDVKKQVRSLCTDAVVETPLSDYNATKPFIAPISTSPSRTCGISFPAISDGSYMDSWNCPIPPAAINDSMHKQQYLNEFPSALTSFGGITIGQPSVSTNSSISGSLPLQHVRDPWVSQRSIQGQEIHKCTNTATGGINQQRDDSNVLLFPTNFGESSNINTVTSGALDLPEYKEVTDVHGNIHNLEGFSLLIDESDQHNPSEDSPCWKGSSSYFSQFQVSETVPSQHDSKSLNSYGGLNLNERQTFSLCCKNPTALFSTHSHAKTTQNTTGRLGEADALLRSSESGYIGNHLYGDPNIDIIQTTNKLGAAEQSSGNGCSFLMDNHISVEGDAVEIDLVKVKKTEVPNPIRLCLETVCCGSDMEKASVSVLGTGLNTNDAHEECQLSAPFKTSKHVLSSLSSDADISGKHGLGNRAGNVPELQPMLLNTIDKLSDLLLLNHLNDDTPVGNENQKILEHVLSKLTMCLMSWTKKSAICKQGPSIMCNGVQIRQYEMINKPQANGVKCHEDGAMLGYTTKGVHEPVRADAREETGNMTKAIKEILDANFHEDTESQPLASIYKNLWLEAEAVLCSTNYKARFHQMKIEMEKCRFQEEEERSLEGKGSPTLVEVFQKSPGASRSVNEDNIMERYNILNCRVKTSNDRGVGSELDSSKITSDQGAIEQVNDVTTSDTFSKDATTGSQSHDTPTNNVYGQQNPTSLTNTYDADMAEDGVMARLEVLKNHGNGPKSISSDKQPSELPMDCVGKIDTPPLRWRSFWEVSDGRFKPAYETEITKAKGVLSAEEGCKGVECASGSQANWETVAHNSDMVELGAQFYGGWCENTSSDWEHVLQDEFTWKVGAMNP